jgi:hypothetical protein
MSLKRKRARSSASRSPSYLDNLAYRLACGELARSFLQGRIFPREASAKPCSKAAKELHPVIKLAMWQEACEILLKNSHYQLPKRSVRYESWGSEANAIATEAGSEANQVASGANDDAA